ncbi:MAG: hypothetical protein P8X96_07070 [Desulfobacteraceae bacterium]
MIYYVLLSVLFLAVFGWLAWRIAMQQAPVAPRPEASYVCTVCNDDHCTCHNKDDAGP